MRKELPEVRGPSTRFRAILPVMHKPSRSLFRASVVHLGVIAAYWRSQHTYVRPLAYLSFRQQLAHFFQVLVPRSTASIGQRINRLGLSLVITFGHRQITGVL